MAFWESTVSLGLDTDPSYASRSMMTGAAVCLVLSLLCMLVAAGLVFRWNWSRMLVVGMTVGAILTEIFWAAVLWRMRISTESDGGDDAIALLDEGENSGVEIAVGIDPWMMWTIVGLLVLLLQIYVVYRLRRDDIVAEFKSTHQ